MFNLFQLNQIRDVSETSEKYILLDFLTFQKYPTNMVSCDFRWVIETSDKEDVRPLKTLTSAVTDVFKTYSGGFKKIMTSYNQTKRFHDVWQMTSELRRLGDVQLTLPWRRPICYVLKTFNLQRLEDVWFITSWRYQIYAVLKTSNFRHLENVWFNMSWRHLNYNVLKMPVNWRLCSSVVSTSIPHPKKWFFRILY